LTQVRLFYCQVMARHVFSHILAGFSGAAVTAMATTANGAIYPLPPQSLSEPKSSVTFEDVEGFLRVGPSVISSQKNQNSFILVPSREFCHRLVSNDDMDEYEEKQREMFDRFNNTASGQVPVGKLERARTLMSRYVFPPGVYHNVASRLTNRQFGDNLVVLDEPEQEIVDIIVKYVENDG